ncbi:MAG: hypothetical protein K0B52_04550, partial [FCB group bacterium]|nr:hypothetical protein [FCB group bacterium]
MKKAFYILSFLLPLSGLFAYELGTESYDRYVIMDHSNSAKGLTYPLSWLQPSGFLFEASYKDSSLTFARWDQLFMIDRSSGGYYNFSADITIRYFPYSFPHRWGAAVEFLNYKGPAATKRADAVLHYRLDKTNILYYHTNNDHMLTMRTSDRHYNIRTHGLRFDHGLGASLQLRGGISYSSIGQGSASEHKDDTFHNFAEIRYHPDKPYEAYTVLEHRYFFNNGQEKTMIAVRPGIRYMSDIFTAH